MIFKILTYSSLLFFDCFAFATYSINDLTLEEKVGQLLIVHFNGEEVNQDAKTLIQDLHVGGIIYYNWANGLHSPQQIRHLSLGLQKLAEQTKCSIPLLICADQEGGLVSRFNQGFTVFPGNKALGMTGQPELAETSAYAIGQELKAVGVNMNLSPVVDVNTDPKNPVIGIRSFGSSPQIVLQFSKNALEGYHRAGIITSLKHFPGHGDVKVDSHEDLPVVRKTKKELKEVDLLPFKELANQADTVMTAHILVPALDSKNCSTLSKSTLDMLRNEFKFKGVIIADSLIMEGVLKTTSSVDEAALLAFNAGCDILMLGGKQLIGTKAGLEITVTDVQRIQKRLVDAVKTGEISEKRLNQSVQRIIDLKNRYNLSIPQEPKDEIAQLVNTVEHQALAKKIASLAIQTIKPKNYPVLPLDQCKVAIFAPSITKDAIHQTSLFHIGKESFPFFFNGLNPSESEILEAKDLAKKVDMIVFCSYNAWKNGSQASLIQSLLDTDKPVILISLRDPLDSALFSKANLILSTFSPTAPSIQAAYDELTKVYY